MAIIPNWFDPSMLVGAALQGYKLDEFLGAGGFGAVYLTKDTNGEPRALKVLFPPHSLGNEDMQVWTVRSDRFLGEATATARFSHPHIIRMFNTGAALWQYDDPLVGQPGHIDLSGAYPLQFYVAEYIPDGVDIRMAQGDLFPFIEAVNIGLQICNALEALHSADPQVLHRDLNPGNIRLAEGNRVVVTDFGVAKIDGVPSAYVSDEWAIFHRGVGAPEQWAGENADERTDIYQLGALLLKMVSGRYPKEGGAAVLGNRKDVPQGLTEAILRCLAEERTVRFQTVAELKAALVGDSHPIAGLSKLWEVSLDSPDWRTQRSPVAETHEGCFVWDRLTVRRLDPVTGSTVWSWGPRPSGNKAEICHGLHSPAVQASERLLYVRHGNLLSCLKFADGTPLWEHQYWSSVAGSFLLVKGIIVLDSYRQTGGGFLGPAGLMSETGHLVWHQLDPFYHVAGMATAEEKLITLEFRGLAGIDGSRVRVTELSTGEIVATQDLLRVGESSQEPGDNYESGEFTTGLQETPAKFGGVRWSGPLVLEDGSIIVWSQHKSSPRISLSCFDSALNLRWNDSFQIGEPRRDVGYWGSGFLMGAGATIWAFQADINSGRRDQRGWAATIDPQTGRLGEAIAFPDNSVPLNASVSQDGSVVFVIAAQSDHAKKELTLWRLMCLRCDIGELTYLEPEGILPDGLMVQSPVCTESRLYLQIPQTRLRKWTRSSSRPVPASVLVYHQL